WLRWSLFHHLAFCLVELRLHLGAYSKVNRLFPEFCRARLRPPNHFLRSLAHHANEEPPQNTDWPSNLHSGHHFRAWVFLRFTFTQLGDSTLHSVRGLDRVIALAQLRQAQRSRHSSAPVPTLH